MKKNCFRSVAGAAFVFGLATSGGPVWAQTAERAEEMTDTASPARSPRITGEQEWARMIQANYPSAALREMKEGTVGVRVAVSRLGRASACEVTSPSGHAVLDEAACMGMTKYARFDPALDDKGKPTEGSYSTRVTYRLNSGASRNNIKFATPVNLEIWTDLIRQDLPEDLLRENPQSMAVVALRLGNQGQVLECHAAMKSSDNDFTVYVCAGLIKHGQFEVQVDDAGALVSSPVAMIGVYAGGTPTRPLAMVPLELATNVAERLRSRFPPRTPEQ